MYYTAYDSVVSDFATTYFFCEKKLMFDVTAGMIPKPHAEITGPGFSIEVEKEWLENAVPNQSSRYLRDAKGNLVAVMTFLGGNMNLLNYQGVLYRIMKLGDSYMAFSEDGNLVFCIKKMCNSNGIPQYARDKIYGMEGYAHEMMVNDDLPLVLQAILAASGNLVFRADR